MESDEILLENGIIIRSARAGEQAEIANVQLNSWREAYRGLLPQEYLDQLPLTFSRRKNWWEKIIAERQKFVLRVAVDKSGIVGFASFEAGRDAGMESLAEVAAIYLFEKFKGQRIGFGLLSSGLKQMGDKGFKRAYCWVLEGNPTIKFYERTGAKFSEKLKSAQIGGRDVQELCFEWVDIQQLFAAK